MEVVKLNNPSKFQWELCSYYEMKIYIYIPSLNSKTESLTLKKKLINNPQKQGRA